VTIPAPSPRAPAGVAAFVVGLAICVLGVAALAWRTAVGPIDDAYILYRFARNVSQGAGFVFNDGQPVEGASSVLWTLVVALFHLVAANPIPWAMAGATIAGIVALAAIALVPSSSSDRVGPARLLAPLLLATTTTFAAAGPAGTDALPFAAAVAGTFLFYLRAAGSPEPRRMYVAGFAASASAMVLARPEGPGLLVLLLVHRLALGRRVPGAVRLRAFVLPVLTLAALLAWRKLTFDAWTPNTYEAKATPHTLALVLRGARYVGDFLLRTPVGLGLLALPCIVRRRDPDFFSASALALGFAGLLAAVGVNGGDHYPGHRLLLGALPLGYALARIGVERLADRRRPLGLAVAAVAIVWAILGSRAGTFALVERMREGRTWSKIGLVLREDLRPNERIAVGALGAIPYHSGAQVVDLYGLIHPEIAKTRPSDMGEGVAGHEKANTAWVLSQRPTRVFFTGVWAPAPYDGSHGALPYRAEQELRAHPQFKNNYEARSLPGGDGVHWVGFFVRKDIPTGLRPSRRRPL